MPRGEKEWGREEMGERHWRGAHGYPKAFPPMIAQWVTKLRNDLTCDHLQLDGSASLYFVHVSGKVPECPCTWCPPAGHFQYPKPPRGNIHCLSFHHNSFSDSRGYKPNILLYLFSFLANLVPCCFLRQGGIGKISAVVLATHAGGQWGSFNCSWGRDLTPCLTSQWI